MQRKIFNQTKFEKVLESVWNKIRQNNCGEAFNLLLRQDNRLLTSEEWTPYLFAKAQCLRGLNQIEEAIKIYMSIEKWEQNNFVLNAIAHCYKDLEQHELANHYFLKKDLLRAYEYLKKGSHQHALKIFTRLSQENKNPSAHLGRARTHEERGDNALAKQFYAQTINLFPEYVETYFYRCRFLLKSQDENAQAELEQAIHKWPTLSSLEALQRVYYPQNEPPEPKPLALYPRLFYSLQKPKTGLENPQLKVLDMMVSVPRKG